MGVRPEKSFRIYDRRRLFDAVAQGDPSELDDLLTYLLETLKNLTDEEFKGKRGSCAIAPFQGLGRESHF